MARINRQLIGLLGFSDLNHRLPDYLYIPIQHYSGTYTYERVKQSDESSNSGVKENSESALTPLLYMYLHI